jgi:hypothetical protein
MRRHWTLAAVLGIGLWLLPAAAQGATFTVSQPTDSALREAVEATNDAEGADTILLPAGTIVLDNEEGGLNVLDDLTIIGAAGGSVLDGSNLGQRILDVDDRTATRIEGVTFTGATRGAISFQPLIQDSAARQVSAADEPQLVVTGSTFTDNDTGGRGTGGAIDFIPSASDASLIVSGSTFSGNRADNDEGFGRGGAINFDRGTMTIENSTFTGNSARGQSFNSGGGAIAVNRGQAALTHVTIASNYVEGGARGGGIRGPVFAVDLIHAQSFVPINVTNSIVAQNTSEGQEEGLARAAALATQPDDCDTQVGSGGGNVESATTCGFKDASDTQNADPGLGPLAANGGATRTMAIGNTSPAYNAAVAGACAATDQRGITRPQFAACDSGAFELAPASVLPSAPVATPTPVAAQRSCLSSRKFRIRLRVPKGEHVRSATVFVNGEKVAVRRGKRLTATVNLRGLTKDRYKVRIVLKLADGSKVTGVRRYWTCTPAIHHTRPPKV